MKYEDIFICNTDTVCGIGGPINQKTLDEIYELKKRPRNKKIMILVGSLEQAKEFSQWNDKASQWALKYWPGAYSIIVNGQGFRMPKNEELCAFLLKNGPMYMTSANLSGMSPIEIEQAGEIFPEVKKVYAFSGTKSNQSSQIYNLDTNEWIR
ncbi:Sua5/YciO/YrdC/YwlC family protein [Mycoplasmopsis iners]|uniref:Sua5/YciO/YrdC/YwlC family protein n=1 Tax=Mycoplasmopsis iners TaxID=76630 RepID=UPI000496A6A1|nr:Sua5/YciO/YrdC/YwlC family protein [Mycoplasmopsis iners]